LAGKADAAIHSGSRRSGYRRGDGLGGHEPQEGDPAGIAGLHGACGACEYGTTGWETLCELQHDSGYSVNGSFADYAIARPRTGAA
jgi:propanol-preferring alcohol dehydrogenase